MDLRRVVDSILSHWGHDVFLQRRIVKKGTGPFNLRENAGFSQTLEKVTSRHRNAGSSGGLTKAVEENIEGKVDNVDIVHYFQWKINPCRGDRIYEYNPNGRQTYIIDWAMPMRGRGGRIVYWITGSTLETNDG